MPLVQTNREVSVSTALGADALALRRLTGIERLGRLSEFRVQLLSEKNDVKIDDILGTTLTVRVTLPGGGERFFNGLVTKFSNNGWSGRLAIYEATVHPWLWLLTQTSNCRIFQEKSVIDILKEVCADGVYGGMIDLDVGLLSGTYEPRVYCVQYRETDFNFVSRLLEEEGIYFFFKHEDGKHTMVLADSYGAHETIEGYAEVKYRGEGSRSQQDEETVVGWRAAGEIQSSGYTLDDFDFEKTSASLSGGLLVKANIPAAFSQPAYERFDYPGGHIKASVGQARAQARLEALHGQSERIEAETTARGLYPGGLFGLVEHPRDDQNREYLITSATYDIANNEYESQSSSLAATTVRISFSALGKEFDYRPLPVTTKPIVQGPQTAMVVGKSGEEIWTDKYGRIKVQFHWDRYGTDDENSSCWVRVSQGWAGKGWGAMFIPRIGMEVVVEFLEGDPDQPLVTGCVYNSDSMPPYPLPGSQTKSTIKSNSSKGGGGFNEIRFEDKKGEEEIFIQAEKDCNRVVKNNDSLKVGFEKADKGDQSIGIKNDRSLDVGNDQSVKIANDHTVSVGNDQKVDIGNDETISIGNDQKLSVSNNQTIEITGNHTLTIDGKQEITVGQNAVIEATTSIELKVGGSSIKIEPAKITISSVQVTVSGSATAELSGGASATIKGAMVMIN